MTATARPGHPARESGLKQPDATACPCGSGERFEACCRPFIEGEAIPPTAERLMRSRFSAYATGDVAYLLDSWHPSSRPGRLQLDPAQHWIRLKIVASSADTVEFIATCKLDGKAHRLHEISRFEKQQGRWYYLGGDIVAG